MSLQCDYYKTAILQLKRGNYNGHVSNAKTYYLLSILERIDKGLLVDNKIKFDDESKKFYETQCLAYKDVVTPFVKPYFHLSSSLFYHIKWNKGTKVESYAKLHQESSLRRSQNMHILMILLGITKRGRIQKRDKATDSQNIFEITITAYGYKI